MEDLLRKFQGEMSLTQDGLRVLAAWLLTFSAFEPWVL